MNPHALRLVPPPPPRPHEHRLWTLTKRDHLGECRVRATPFGPELCIYLDGELWWSHLYRRATEERLTAEADRKRDEFTAKGLTMTTGDNA